MRPRHVHKTVQICIIIAIVLVATASVGNGQTIGTVNSTKKYVVFRCDDVAPKAKFAELQALTQVHVDMNVPVTLGVVPHPTTGAGNELLADSKFVSYMKSLASNNLFEFAQHGYTHQNQGMNTFGPSEFYGRPYALQYNAIKQGRDDIHAAFGVTPTSFIPPFDKGDDNTLKAAKALGFTEYSTAFRDFNMNQGTRDGVHVETVSLVLANESLQSAESKTSQFLADTHSIDTFVVLYHPADFSAPGGSVNKEKIMLLKNYIGYLKGRGDVQFTTVDHSWTTGNTNSTHPASDTGSTQQKAVTLPFGEGGSALLGGLGGAFAFLLVNSVLVFLLVGITLALLLCAYLILSRRGMKRRSR
ncbi:MAG: DUF2334 domain-containing protein [Halobacteriota archaeon]